MKLEGLDHPKTYDFAARLDVSRPTAIGHLELLWAFVSQKAPQGNVGKWPDGAIARACDWMGDPAKFVGALRDCGLLDADSKHRLVVHDWAEHAPRWVQLKLQKLKLDIVGVTTEPTIELSIEPTAEPSSRVGKPSGVKGSSPTAAAPPPEDWFLGFKAVYPRRAGDQGWPKALRAAHARIAEGHTPAEFLNGAERYAAYCLATENTGTEYVKQAATFLGPDKPFLLPWKPPPSKAQLRQDANVSVSLEWLEKADAAN
jgi:hypothetical protein